MRFSRRQEAAAAAARRRISNPLSLCGSIIDFSSGLKKDRVEYIKVLTRETKHGHLFSISSTSIWCTENKRILHVYNVQLLLGVTIGCVRTFSASVLRRSTICRNDKSIRLFSLFHSIAWDQSRHTLALATSWKRERNKSSVSILTTYICMVD